jgi:hypothetical protein
MLIHSFNHIFIHVSDLIFSLDLPTQKHYERVKQAVLDSLLGMSVRSVQLKYKSFRSSEFMEYLGSYSANFQDPEQAFRILSTEAGL